MALACDIQKRFPKRRIILILHTGGVTRRTPEITSIFPAWHYRFVEDFHPKDFSPSKGKTEAVREKVILRYLVKNSVKFLGISASCDDDREFSNLKPWVLSCRGHYSYRTIAEDFLVDLNSRLTRNVSGLDLNQSCAIHYRLGDLMTLDEKNPISSNVLISEFKKISETHGFQSLVIYSDSPRKAYEFFSQLNSTRVYAPELDTAEVMSQSIDSKFFIGTSSKISFWISGIRAQVNGTKSLLPLNNIPQYSGISGPCTDMISNYSVNE